MQVHNQAKDFIIESVLSVKGTQPFDWSCYEKVKSNSRGGDAGAPGKHIESLVLGKLPDKFKTPDKGINPDAKGSELKTKKIKNISDIEKSVSVWLSSFDRNNPRKAYDDTWLKIRKNVFLLKFTYDESKKQVDILRAVLYSNATSYDDFCKLSSFNKPHLTKQGRNYSPSLWLTENRMKKLYKKREVLF